MFYEINNGVLVFTDHSNDIEGLQKRITNAVNVAGIDRRELEGRVQAMIDIVIHMRDKKIDSYVNYKQSVDNTSDTKLIFSNQFITL